MKHSQLTRYSKHRNLTNKLKYYLRLILEICGMGEYCAWTCCCDISYIESLWAVGFYDWVVGFLRLNSLYLMYLSCYVTVTRSYRIAKYTNKPA